MATEKQIQKLIKQMEYDGASEQDILILNYIKEQTKNIGCYIHIDVNENKITLKVTRLSHKKIKVDSYKKVDKAIKIIKSLIKEYKQFKYAKFNEKKISPNMIGCPIKPIADWGN